MITPRTIAPIVKRTILEFHTHVRVKQFITFSDAPSYMSRRNSPFTNRYSDSL
jgi:hypothetical protein